MKVYAHKKDNSYLEFDLTGQGWSGGEGTVYRIGPIPGLQGSFCAKIYHTEFLAKHKKEKYAKLSYMVGHRPQTLSDNRGMIQICYPSFLLFDSPIGGNFIGYGMYLALENSTDLQKVAMNISKARFDSLRRNGKPDIIGEEIFKKFPRPQKSSDINQLINRYKIVHNIASLINYLHQDGRYVIGDIKPENILMTVRAGISLVDVDSVQIVENKKLLFSNEACTPEYCPPEFLRNPRQNQVKAISFDLFSMSVLFYQILIGTHPYTYTIPHQQKQNDTIGNIITGYFANGKKRNFINRPPCHLLFDQLPKSIQNFFQRAFEGKPEQRPTALEWQTTLCNLILNLTSSPPHQRPSISVSQTMTNPQKNGNSCTTNLTQDSSQTLSTYCFKCGQRFYKLVSRFCTKCGAKRI